MRIIITYLLLLSHVSSTWSIENRQIQFIKEKPKHGKKKDMKKDKKDDLRNSGVENGKRPPNKQQQISASSTTSPTPPPSQSTIKKPIQKPFFPSWPPLSPSPTCKDSDSFTFGSYYYNGKAVVKDCAWLTKHQELRLKRTFEWCFSQYENTIIASKCPLTCNQCSIYGKKTTIPSSAPSIEKTTPIPSSIPHSVEHSSIPSSNPSQSETYVLFSRFPSQFPSQKTESTSNPSVIEKSSQIPSVKENVSQSPSSRNSVQSHNPTSVVVDESSPRPSVGQYESSTQPTSTDSSMVKLSIGYSQNAFVRSSGEVQVWGNNVEGQLGHRKTEEFVSKPSLLSYNVEQVKFGLFHTCLVLQRNVLTCWGDNRYGQLGNNSTNRLEYSNSTIVGANNYKPVKLALGKYHTCATLNHELNCWGYNRYGQLGDGTTVDSYVPKKVLFEEEFEVIQIAAGHFHTCAILLGKETLNELMCWGLQLGNNKIKSKPQVIAEGRGLKQISLGAYHGCIISKESLLKCWGYNDQGQVGDNNPGSYRYEPTIVNVYNGAESVEIREISLGGYHSCAISVQNELFCWGENFDGQLGDGTTFPSIVPKRVKIKLNDDLSQVDLGATHSCALTRIKKTVYCWGSNWSSQLGDGSFAKSSTPKEISISDLQSETISTITDSSAMWHGQIKSSYFTAILTLIVYIF